MKNHVNTVHGVNGKVARMYLCQICGKSFKSAAAVNTHTKVVHRGENGEKFPCHICNRLYKSEYSLRSHIKTGHESIPQNCPICGKSTPNPTALTRYDQSIQ